jgi:Bacteriophage Lambda NinG protein.
MRNRRAGQSFSALRNRAASIVSIYIRLKYSNKDGIVQCVTCPSRGHWQDFDSGHFLKGRSLSISNLLDERGQHPQCQTCNRVNDGAPKQYEAFMLKQYGQEVVDELRMNRRKVTKITSAELRDFIQAYRQKVKTLRFERRPCAGEPHYTDNLPF